MTGADTTTRLLDEAHAALCEMESPATQVVDALRLAHQLNPTAGIRMVLQRCAKEARAE